MYLLGFSTTLSFVCTTSSYPCINIYFLASEQLLYEQQSSLVTTVLALPLAQSQYYSRPSSTRLGSFFFHFFLLEFLSHQSNTQKTFLPAAELLTNTQTVNKRSFEWRGRTEKKTVNELQMLSFYAI